MPAPKGKDAAAISALDDFTRSAIYGGLSINQIAAVFGMDKRTVTTRIQVNAVQPYGMRLRYPTFRIRDVAPYIVEPAGDMSAYIKKMQPSDLPVLLQKEYWNGLRARQAYEEDQEDLHRTADVEAAMADAFKTARMSLLLLSDRVEREVAFTDIQREKLKSLVDQTLEKLRADLESFATEAEGSPEEAAYAESGGGVDDASFWADPAEWSEEEEEEDPAAGL